MSAPSPAVPTVKLEQPATEALLLPPSGPAGRPDPPREATAEPRPTNPVASPMATAADPRPERGGGDVVTALRAPDGAPAWPCALCGNRNPIDLGACFACGTPFGQGYDEPRSAPEVAPSSALLASLLLPGLGQIRCGNTFDGAARVVLFLWTMGATVVLLISRSGRGLGGIAPLLLLFALSAAAVYVLSAVDAYRLAGGQHVLVTSRMLLWASVGLIVLSALLATFATIGAVRGR